MIVANDFIKRDTDLVKPKADSGKSIQTKRAWGKHLRAFLTGIQKYHKSLEGRRMHRKMGMFNATKAGDLLPKLDLQKRLLSLRQELKPTTPMGEKKILLQDEFAIDESFGWSINESVVDGQQSVVDGENVLARVSGPFFLVNGVSNNKRFYSRRLWENALGKMKKVLERGGALGTVGHDQDIDEKAILEGKISHIVTKLWIDESSGKPVGMGEALILGTPAGKTLNAIFRAGYKVPVSSRAFGTYRGTDPNTGAAIIDEDSFEPKTFDFVLSPGVETAFPTIRENYTTVDTEKQIGEETLLMDPKDQIIKQLHEERLALQADLNEAVKASEQLNVKVQEQAKRLGTLAKMVETYKQVVGPVDQAKRLDEGLRKFLELEPLKSFAQDMGLVDLVGGASGVHKLLAVTEAYRKLGNPAELKSIKESAGQYQEKGSIEEVNKLIAVTESYANTVGSPKQAAKLVAENKNYRQLGTVSEIRQVFKLAREFFKLGKIHEVKAKLDEAKKLETTKKADQKRNVAIKIAEAFDQDVEVIAEMLKHMPAAKVIEIKKKEHDQRDVEKRFRVAESAPAVKGKKPVAGPQLICEKLWSDMETRD